jgi:hypothetical protein
MLLIVTNCNKLGHLYSQYVWSDFLMTKSFQDGLPSLNVETLQEIFAVKYYKIYRRFPEPSKRDNEKKFLIHKIRLLERL